MVCSTRGGGRSRSERMADVTLPKFACYLRVVSGVVIETFDLKSATLQKDTDCRPVGSGPPATVVVDREDMRCI